MSQHLTAEEKQRLITSLSRACPQLAPEYIGRVVTWANNVLAHPMDEDDGLSVDLDLLELVLAGHISIGIRDGELIFLPATVM